MKIYLLLSALLVLLALPSCKKYDYLCYKRARVTTGGTTSEQIIPKRMTLRQAERFTADCSDKTYICYCELTY